MIARAASCLVILSFVGCEKETNTRKNLGVDAAISADNQDLGELSSEQEKRRIISQKLLSSQGESFNKIREELEKLVDLDSDSASIIWKRISSQELTSEQITSLRFHLTTKLASLGRESIACEIVSQNMGLGSEREEFMRAIFREGRSDLKELFTLYETLEDLDRVGARDGLIFQAALDPASSIQQFADSLENDEMSWRSSILLDGLSIAVNQRKGLEAIFIGLEAEVPAEKFDEACSYIFNKTYGSDLENIWEIFEGVSERAGLGNMQESRASLLERISFFKPEFILDMAVKEASSIQRDEVSIASRRLAELDPIRAVEFYAEARGLGVEMSVLEGLASGLVEYSIGVNELDSAKEWLVEVRDAEFRAELGGLISAKQGDLLRSQAFDRPAETLSEITGQESSTEAFWVEVAMEQWLKKDATEAYQWYQENQGTLTPEQDERVALAYAREGVRQGDLETAGEWAQRIADPELRQVVEGEIAGAGAGGVDKN